MGGAGDFVRLLGVHTDSADLYLDDTWYVTKEQADFCLAKSACCYAYYDLDSHIGNNDETHSDVLRLLSKTT